MEEKLLKMHSFFEEEIALCKCNDKKLLADGRADEANFEKVKANIYQIFRTVLSVAQTQCKDDPEGLRTFFMLRIEQIPLSWVDAHEKAEAHHDEVRMYLEQLKLDTVGKIRDRFSEIWEDVQ